MKTNYSYEEKSVPFEHSNFSVPEVPDLKKKSLFLFGHQDRSGQSELMMIDLEQKKPVQTVKIEKRYPPGLVYYPPTGTLYSAYGKYVNAHDLTKNKVNKIPMGKEMMGQANNPKARVCGDLILVLQGMNMLMVNTQNFSLSMVQIGDKDSSVIDYIHLGGNMIGVLYKNKRNSSEGMCKTYDIVKKQLITSFKVDFKMSYGQKARPTLFYNYKQGRLIVYRGVEETGGDQIVGTSILDMKSMKVSSLAFKIQGMSGDKPIDIKYCDANDSIYVASENGNVFQIHLSQDGRIGTLGRFNCLNEIATHPSWDGVLLLFRPQQGLMKMGFVYA